MINGEDFSTHRALSTNELEKHIRNQYSLVEPLATQENVFIPLKIKFAKPFTSEDFTSCFCFADNSGYHHIELGDRGQICEYPVAIELLDFTFEVLRHYIFLMATNYERWNRTNGEDSRRCIFDKELQYWSMIGEPYLKRGKQEIKKILQEHPFNDSE